VREKRREKKKFLLLSQSEKIKIVSALSREKGQRCSSSSNDDDGRSGQ